MGLINEQQPHPPVATLKANPRDLSEEQLFVFVCRPEAKIWNVHLLLEHYMFNFVVFIEMLTISLIHIIRCVHTMRFFFFTDMSKETLETIEMGRSTGIVQL